MTESLYLITLPDGQDVQMTYTELFDFCQDNFDDPNACYYLRLRGSWGYKFGIPLKCRVIVTADDVSEGDRRISQKSLKQRFRENSRRLYSVVDEQGREHYLDGNELKAYCESKFDNHLSALKGLRERGSYGQQLGCHHTCEELDI